MADTKVSLLTDGVTANTTDRIPAARSPYASGDNVYVSPAYIRTYILGQDLAIGAANVLSWTGRSIISSPADGYVLMTNNAGTGFTGIRLGGNTSSFPLIKRNTSAVDFKVGDDTGYTNITFDYCIGSRGLFITSSAATFGMGFLAGSGGAVTQATSKSTGVTLNKWTGAITMNNAALAAGTTVGFTLTNSMINAADVVIVNIKSGATANSYSVTVGAVAAGSCLIELRNDSAGSLGEAVVLSFVVLRGAIT
jgi:hypothetical protein